MSHSAIRFEDVRFRAGIREHASSTFLGYADATLVVPGCLDGDDLEIRIRGIQVKLLNGKVRMDFPQERGANGVWYPIVFPKSAASREALTEALFADRAIGATASCVLEDQARKTA